MNLKNLSLVNFKNFDSFEMDFCSKINCLIGDNGIGKTNILDSIHYLSFCKSFLNINDKQNIKIGESFFVIQGSFEINDEIESIYCGLQKDKRKSFRKNGIEYNRLSEHIGLLPVVFSSPCDSDLIHGVSQVRRKFANSIISQFDRSYLNNLISYNHALEQRNVFLKNNYSNQAIDLDVIEVLNMQLVDYGIKIYESRKLFAEEIISIFNNYYKIISGDNESVSIQYESQIENENFEELLKSNLRRDLALGHTSIGVHKDNFSFLIDGNAIKKFGSQGQQKTFVLSLKFAWYDYIKSKMNLSPILLLDDIFDKLDKKRVRAITQLVSESNFGQIFITDTSYTRMPDILKDLQIEYKILNLSDNKQTIS